MSEYMTKPISLSIFFFIIKKRPKEVNTVTDNESSYRDKKVMSIGIVKELTGLSERQIRYYEKRKLIFPERTTTTSGKDSRASSAKLRARADIAQR